MTRILTYGSSTHHAWDSGVEYFNWIALWVRALQRPEIFLAFELLLKFSTKIIGDTREINSHGVIFSNYSVDDLP